MKLSIEESEGSLLISWNVWMGEIRRKAAVGLAVLTLAIFAYLFYAMRRMWNTWTQEGLFLVYIATTGLFILKAIFHLSRAPGYARLSLTPTRLDYAAGDITGRTAPSSVVRIRNQGHSLWGRTVLFLDTKDWMPDDSPPLFYEICVAPLSWLFLIPITWILVRLPGFPSRWREKLEENGVRLSLPGPTEAAWVADVLERWRLGKLFP